MIWGAIYKIWTFGGEYYLGSSTTPESRWKYHVPTPKSYRRSTISNKRLRDSYKKNGSIMFSILEEGFFESREALYDLEQLYLDNTLGDPYRVNRGKYAKFYRYSGPREI